MYVVPWVCFHWIQGATSHFYIPSPWLFTVDDPSKFMFSVGVPNTKKMAMFIQVSGAKWLHW
jgi:hypothetical protein